MKILLILPAGERVRVTRERPRVPRRAMLRFSVLSLTTVAALTLREHAVRIVDENVAPLDFDLACDLVGVTFMTALAPRAYEIAREFRARGKIVVGGGYHPTLCPADAAPHFDALVCGDAEGAWERVVADVEKGHVQKVYRAVSCAESLLQSRSQVALGNAHVPATPLLPPPLPAGQAGQDKQRSTASPASAFPSANWERGESLKPEDLRPPIPRRELLARTAQHYATINAVQTGRGCRHACRYCSVTVFHQQTYRRRPVADVVAELQTIPRDFIFVDDNIIADRDYARELFRVLAPLRKRWVSQCSILIADDPELLELAHAAGCCGMFIGIETVSAANLAAMNKQFNDTSRYADRLRAIRRAGIGVVAGMIVGMDDDDAGVFERMQRFLARTGIDAVQLNILTPLPGTPLFAAMEQAGRVTDRDWSHYDYRHVVFRPARMTATELQAGADWLYAQFYRLDRILWRFARGVGTVGWQPALLGLKLGLTYRYDNRREGIVGENPAATKKVVAAGERLYNWSHAEA